MARWREAALPGWERLVEEDPNATPAHRPAFAQALAAALPEMVPEWVTVERAGELLGGAPVVIERRAALHWIHAMPFLLSGAPLARPGAHAEVDARVAEALDARARDLRAVGGEWVLDRPGDPEPFAALERVPGETRFVESSWIELATGLEAAWRAVGAGTRRAIARARAQGLAIHEEPEALEEAYALYAAQARGWAGHRLRPLELLRRLLRGSAPAGRLLTVRDARGLLAAVLVLVARREWMAWWSGSHPEARRQRGAFALLEWSVAERAALAGAARLNLGGSAGRPDVAQFKRRLGARVRRHPVRWIAPAYAGGLGRLVAAVQSRVRATRARGAERA